MLPPKDNFAAWKNIGEGRKDETGEQGEEEESEDVWEEDRFSVTPLFTVAGAHFHLLSFVLDVQEAAVVVVCNGCTIPFVSLFLYFSLLLVLGSLPLLLKNGAYLIDNSSLDYEFLDTDLLNIINDY